MPRPGSNEYDIHRARLRKQYEDQGIPDDKANELANRTLQAHENMRPRRRTERAAGPKGERE